MNPSCEHKRETLVHGLMTLASADELVFQSFGASYHDDPNLMLIRAEQTLRSFIEHEAVEAGVEDLANQLVRNMREESFARLKKEFVDRALAALIECECGKKE